MRDIQALMKRFIKQLEEGCSTCEFDEAEGGLMDHCDKCCRQITTMAYEILVINMEWPELYDLTRETNHTMTREEQLELALRGLRDTVKEMRKPQTIADVALLILKFRGPLEYANKLLK